MANFCTVPDWWKLPSEGPEPSLDERMAWLSSKTIVSDKWIRKHFLKQIIKLFVRFQSYLSQVNFAWNKQISHVDTGGYVMLMWVLLTYMLPVVNMKKKILPQSLYFLFWYSEFSNLILLHTSISLFCPPTWLVLSCLYMYFTTSPSRTLESLQSFKLSHHPGYTFSSFTNSLIFQVITIQIQSLLC